MQTHPLSSTIRTVAGSFAIHGSFLSAEPHGSGHINDTCAAWFSQGGTRVRYILQRINDRIFKDPAGLMDNITRVTRWAKSKLEEAGALDSSRRALTVVPSLGGASHSIDAEGRSWRCYLFIEGARTYDIVESANQAREAAKAFGAFQGLVADLPGPRLHETIPDFHNTRARFEKLKQAVEADAMDRLKGAGPEWDFVRRREESIDRLIALQASGAVPERITHNDTKLNNVMVDDATESGICVVDLDTVMPGLVLHDFGDMVRTATSPAAEDERDLSKVAMRMPMFEALVEGYLSSARPFLTDGEISELAFSGKLITLEIGIRFLTDHLEGDVYFKTRRPGQNLDRCRTQFALVKSIEDRMEEMEACVRRLAK